MLFSVNSKNILYILEYPNIIILLVLALTFIIYIYNILGPTWYQFAGLHTQSKYQYIHFIL